MFFFTGWQDVISRINKKLIKDCIRKHINGELIVP